MIIDIIFGTGVSGPNFEEKENEKENNEFDGCILFSRTYGM